jgi:hypothetical protein
MKRDFKNHILLCWILIIKFLLPVDQNSKERFQLGKWAFQLEID